MIARMEAAVVNVLQSTDLQHAIDGALLEPDTQDAALTPRYTQQLVKVSISPAAARVRLRLAENQTE